jgi:hypothetical protein
MKTRRLLTLGGSAIAFVLLGMATAGATSAQEAAAGSSGGDTSASFQRLDKNQDGRLTRSELPADMPLLRSRLATYDSNHDGMLDAHEFAAAEAALHGSGHAGSGEGSPPSRRSGG